MKTSTLVFNVAAVVTLLAILYGLVDLAKHKTKSFGVVTDAPATPAPVIITLVPTLQAVEPSEDITVE